MPGVPSGRGCNQCRQIKKKCDQQQPSCSRCRRLGLECVGGGLRRFKFVEPALVRYGSSSQDSEPASRSSSSSASRSLTPAQDPVWHRSSISASPSDAVSQLVRAFTATIDPSVSERFNLVMSYGQFVQYIPSRLGRNAALDASIATLVEAHSDMCRRSRASQSALSKYSHALVELRRTLDDPVEACSSDTLAATMILCMTQSFMGSYAYEGYGHIIGMANIMRYRGSFTGSQPDGFESILHTTLRGPVIFEALFSGNVDFTNEEWEALATNYQIPGTGPADRMMLCATRAVIFLSRAKQVRQHGAEDPALFYDITSTYESMQQYRTSVSGIVAKLQQRFTAGELDYTTFFQYHFVYIRLYALALCLVCVIGAMMSTINPDYPELEKDMHDCVVEALNLAERLQPYRPLGAGIIPITLGAVWTVVKDPRQKEQVKDSIKDYMRDNGQDVPGEVWMRGMHALKMRITLQD